MVQRLIINIENRSVEGIIRECDELSKIRGMKRFFSADKISSGIAGTKESIGRAMETFAVCFCVATLWIIKRRLI